MTVHNSTDALAAEMLAIGAAARDAARAMREASGEAKTKALMVAAAAIRSRAAEILAANKADIEAAKAADMPANMVDRLALNEARIEAMAAGIEVVAALPDPVGRELARWSRPNGLDIARVATPIGVIGIIYESRPNVTADAGALALKSGNVAILRGGSDSIRSSGAIRQAMAEGLKAAGLPETAIQMVRLHRPRRRRHDAGRLERHGGPDHSARRQGPDGPRHQRGAGAGAGASGRALPCLSSMPRPIWKRRAASA